jgi:biopolymer transport protein ExbD
MAIHTSKETGGIFAAINITPLTDIFLVLLIIFMVATAVTVESAAHVDLPKMQAPTTSQPPRSITVTYTATHHVFLNAKPVTEAELGPALKDALAHASDKSVVFDGDPQVILGDMVRILDIAKGAGADKVALAVGNSGGGGGSEAAAEPDSAPEEPAPETVAPAEGGMP